MESACCKVSEAGLRQDAFRWLGRTSFLGLPIACPQPLGGRRPRRAKSSSSGKPLARPGAGSAFLFFLISHYYRELCVCYSDPNQRNIKSLSGWQLWLLRHRAVRGAEEKWFSLASSAMWQWKCNSCRDPTPNHQLVSAPACSLNKALWLPNIIHLPEEPWLRLQLPSSSRSEHERWTESDRGAGLTTCREERAVFKAPLICYGNKTQQKK